MRALQGRRATHPRRMPRSMAMRHLFPTGLALVLALCGGGARAADDLASLRAEIQALRATYAPRLQALGARLQAAERSATTAQAPAAPAAAPAPAPAAAPAAAPLPAAGAATTASASSFNPALSLILSGLYTRTSRDPADYRISGFARPQD